VESLVKLIAFVAVGIYALSLGDASLSEMAQPLRDLADKGFPPGFAAQTALAFAAMFCLPRQFQVGVVECEDPRDVRRARRMFPFYLILISVLVVPILIAGRKAAIGTALTPDAYLLWLPLSHDVPALAILAYIGGFSAATGMVIVEAVALATMISNELVMPALLRLGGAGLRQPRDLAGIVLTVRRVAIVLIALLAFGYYRSMAQNRALASFGLLAFAAVVQFVPALVGALYWRGVSRIGVLAGLFAGFGVWIYTLLLPSLSQLGGLSQTWLVAGPFGLSWLAPTALFHVSGWDPITHGAFWSLLANVGCCVMLSMHYPPSVDERLRAQAFLQPFDERVLPEPAEWRGRVRIADLTAVIERILGDRSAARVFADYATPSGKPLSPHDMADRAMLQHTERVLAGAIGAECALFAFGFAPALVACCTSVGV
jgi:Na+/proline symporter